MLPLLALLGLSAGAGVNISTPVGDELWYDQGLPHELNLTSFTWRAGIDWDASPHWRLSAAWLDAGVQHITATITNDANYDNVAHRCLNNPCSPLYQWQESGRWYGTELLIEWRSSWLGLAVGGVRYVSDWAVNNNNYVERRWAPAAAVAVNIGDAGELRLDAVALCKFNHCWDYAGPGPQRYAFLITYSLRFDVD
jgi:hypothetical protein